MPRSRRTLRIDLSHLDDSSLSLNVPYAPDVVLSCVTSRPQPQAVAVSRPNNAPDLLQLHRNLLSGLCVYYFQSFPKDRNEWSNSDILSALRPTGIQPPNTWSELINAHHRLFCGEILFYIGCHDDAHCHHVRDPIADLRDYRRLNRLDMLESVPMPVERHLEHSTTNGRPRFNRGP